MSDTDSGREEQGGGTNHELPEWVPEEYDPEAPLTERLPIIAEMEGGIEVHVKDDRGVVEVVHEPQHFYDNPRRMKLACGVAIDDWKWEIIVPKGDSSPVLKRVDPMQEHHAYLATQSRWMENIDIRVYGVDTDRWQEAAEA